MPFSFAGIIPAVWTPTDADGRLLRGALRQNLDWMLDAGVKQLLMLGSTGEFVHLSSELRKEVLEAALEHLAGRDVPVFVNISHTNPRTVVELGRHAKSAGAASVTLLPPWFYPMSDADLVEFFVRAIEAIDLPLGLYNFQAMTGKRLTPELVRAIAKRAPVAGLKHSAGELQEHKALAEVGAEFGFKVVTGWDTHYPEATALGATGCISGLANVVPELMLEIDTLLKSGRVEDLYMPAGWMRRIGDLVGQLEFPHNVAAAMEARGLEAGVSKAHRSAATEAKYLELRNKLMDLFTEMGLPTMDCLFK